MTISLFMNKDKNPEIGQKDKHDIFPMSLYIPVSSTLMPLCFNIRCNPSLSWRKVPFYALIVQRLTSNWIIEETPREKPLSPKFNLPFDKNGDKKFFDPQEGVCSQKNGVIDGSWQEFLAQIFPLHCRLIPESFMLMCSKEKKVC